ncbi:DNA replication and repair protein recF [Lacticaseibacillus pantheris DSM 15945 = JCM 12539 = NBRC 106106]|uniref:DNA replication and repair protein RecF n=2 Tax=Lacticaseibacillus TaxID=2759736 RepID=A0A0R1U6B0_9LACO|nr:DNA replication/repair protein RecF [Lacticaseibacillus pantheris]KRL86597.1 DNA replication and repair protein recF [Lacticaseibacillus pantheris DSM 15945 = JCM 12539 = NBRC 106106]
MYLQHLTLRDYRNYQSVDTDFSPQINVLIGANAQGKTNLLESVYALALARSHRTNNDRDLIRFGSEFARVDGTVVRSTGPVKLGLVVSKQGKRARINGRDAPRLSQYLGKLNVILFAPEDLNLVKGSPALRRRFIDMEFGQMSAKYLYNLAQYKVTLKQRNAYLKQLKYGQARDTVYLDVLTEQLAQFGAAVAVARAELLANMGQFAGVIHHDITRGGEELQLRYETQIDDQALQSEEATTKDLLAQYQQARSRELDQGTTLVGPHRDDIEFIVNDRNVAVYGSQGQQRTAALAVKLAEIDLMKQETGEYPVLLLDDVLSELDDSRQTHLLKAIQDKVQTFLTTTSLDGIAREIIQAPNVLRVQAGTLEAAGND